MHRNKPFSVKVKALIFGVLIPALYAVSNASANNDDVIPASAESESEIQTDIQTEMQTEVQTVRVVEAATVQKPIEHSAPGRVISINRARIAAEVNARILAINVQVGELVQQGEIIAQLDCSDYDDALIETQARLDALQFRRTHAKQQLERNRKLAQTRTVSEDILNLRQMEYDTAVAEIAAQRAQQQRAQNQTTRCSVQAPFDGVVTERVAQLGEFTAPGAVLVELVDVRNVELSVQIPIDQSAAMQNAGSGEFRSAQGGYRANLRTLLPVIDTVSRSREARLRFDVNTPLVGDSGRFYWRSAELAIPANYVLSRKGQLGVFIVEHVQTSQAQATTVAKFVGAQNALEGRAAVINLSPGTQIVSDGRHALQDGDPIRVAPSAPQ